MKGKEEGPKPKPKPQTKCVCHELVVCPRGEEHAKVMLARAKKFADREL